MPRCSSPLPVDPHPTALPACFTQAPQHCGANETCVGNTCVAAVVLRDQTGAAVCSCDATTTFLDCGGKGVASVPPLGLCSNLRIM